MLPEPTVIDRVELLCPAALGMRLHFVVVVCLGDGVSRIHVLVAIESAPANENIVHLEDVGAGKKMGY